jgi:ribulose 1,5-bisphosphate carboxylase large subunit-like protein
MDKHPEGVDANGRACRQVFQAETGFALLARCTEEARNRAIEQWLQEHSD